MELSKNWIGDYVELPASVDELARRLTDVGHAVELIEERGDDHVFDMDITTNRVDCMNHFGMAREVAVLFDRPLKRPEVLLDEVEERAADGVTIEIEDPDLCHRYVGRVVRGATIGPSPDWLKERLEAIGLRSISNIVDVTNYVLWELGQPLHAFDLDKVGEHTIRVRRAKDGEILTTLDGEERKLEAGMLIIADVEIPVALAGVMGGLDSEVTDATRDILIESAWFDPKSVRRTAKRLGMHTDASHRFERGADPEMCAFAADRAAALMVEVAGGEILSGAVDAYPTQRPPRTIPLDPDRLRAFAGAEIPDADVERWLQGLGCEVDKGASGSPWSITVPSWRHLDFELPADLFEEAIRLYGFDQIQSALPRLEGADGQTTRSHRLGMKVREILAAAGYLETINFAFHDAKSDTTLPGLYAQQTALELANPLSERYAVMRRSLLPNLLESARFNQRRGAESVRLFELGHVFCEGGEMETLAVVAGGTQGTPWRGIHEIDFFDVKGILETLAEESGVVLRMSPQEFPGLVPGTGAALLAAGSTSQLVGYCGRLVEEEAYPLFVAELRTDCLAGEARSLQVTIPSRYPGVGVDLTFTHAVTVPWAELEAAIREHEPRDLVAFRLQDRYQGKGVPEGAVNTTMAFLYASPEGALTQETVNERQKALLEELERRFGWEG